MALLELAQELIRIKSISPKDNGCFDVIENKLVDLNFDVQKINYSNVENLLARYGSSGPVFCFLGHTDVVPEGPIDQWSSTDQLDLQAPHQYDQENRIQDLMNHILLVNFLRLSNLFFVRQNLGQLIYSR